MMNLAGLNAVLRWREDSELKFKTSDEVISMKENLAEHVGAMATISNWLYTKAEQENDQTITSLEYRKIISYVTLHDGEEIITSDMRHKDADHYKLERQTRQQILQSIEHLNIVEKLAAEVSEYENKSTPEARFVKAVDELQAWLYMIVTKRVEATTRDLNDPESIKGYQYSKEFTTVYRIMKVVLQLLRRNKLTTYEVFDFNKANS